MTFLFIASDWGKADELRINRRIRIACAFGPR